MLSNKLDWSDHCEYLHTKGSQRLYLLVLLRRAGVPDHDILWIYTSMIRSVLEYAAPVWHTSLSQEQSERLESVQKRALRVVYPDPSYRRALSLSGMRTLHQGLEDTARNFFVQLLQPGHNCTTCCHSPGTLGTISDPCPNIQDRQDQALLQHPGVLWTCKLAAAYEPKIENLNCACSLACTNDLAHSPSHFVLSSLMHFRYLVSITVCIVFTWVFFLFVPTSLIIYIMMYLQFKCLLLSCICQINKSHLILIMLSLYWAKGVRNTHIKPSHCTQNTFVDTVRCRLSRMYWNVIIAICDARRRACGCQSIVAIFSYMSVNCMMQCTQCSCHAPSGGQQIQQLVGRSDFKCVIEPKSVLLRSLIERSGRCVKLKELEILRHFQIWGCLYNIRHGVAADREKNQQRLEKDNIRECQRVSEGEKKRVLSTSTSLCRQLWLCYRHLGSSWICGLLYQDLLWDRAKLLGLGLSSLSSALLHCRERYFRDLRNLRNLRTFGLHWPVRLKWLSKTSIILLLGHRRVS